jgi:hypothetical protein
VATTDAEGITKIATKMRTTYGEQAAVLMERRANNHVRDGTSKPQTFGGGWPMPCDASIHGVSFMVASASLAERMLLLL